MKVIIIGQDPLDVTAEEAKAIIQSITAGAEYIVIGGEYVKASAITGVRNGQETLPAQLWGALPAERMKKFTEDKRASVDSAGYKKFQEMKQKLINRM